MQPVTHFVRTRLYGTKNTQFMDHSEQTPGSLIPLFRPDQVVAKTGSVLRDYTRNPNHVMLDEDPNDARFSFDFTDSGCETRQCPASSYQESQHVMLDEDMNDPCISFDFTDSEHHTFHIH